MSLRNDSMRFSVLGFRCDIWIELQAPVIQANTMSLRNDSMRFSVLGFRCDIWIELQAPVIQAKLAFNGKLNNHQYPM